jgi:hypothetical protein
MGSHNRNTATDYEARHDTSHHRLSPVAILVTLMIAASIALLWKVVHDPGGTNQSPVAPAAGLAKPRTSAAIPSATFRQVAASPSISPRSSSTPSTPSASPTSSAPSTQPAAFGVDITDFAYDPVASTPTAKVTVHVITPDTQPVTLVLYFAGGNYSGEPGDNADLEHEFTLSGRTTYDVTDSITALQFCYTRYFGVSATLKGVVGLIDFSQLPSPACT